MTSHGSDSPEALPGTFITSVVDPDVEGQIHVYYQSKDGGLVREFHNDRKGGEHIPSDQNTAMKLHSPLASVCTIARGSDIPEVRVYAQNPSDMIIGKIPKYEPITAAAVGTKFSAAYDGNNVYIQYQKTGFENEIFEKNLKTGTEVSVCHDVLPGTNISTVETSIRPKPLSSNSVAPLHGDRGGGVGICRYMAYTGTDKYLWFNWIDAPNEPEIEQVQSLKPDKMWPNTPVALAPVIDILTIYFLNESGQISRVDRGDYGWGVPRVVGKPSIKPHPGTNLAAAKDTTKGEREVWISCQDKDGVITGFHDTVDGT